GSLFPAFSIYRRRPVSYLDCPRMNHHTLNPFLPVPYNSIQKQQVQIMIRSLFLCSFLALTLFPLASLAAEPASTSVESAGYQQFAAPGALLSVFGSGFPSGIAINETATTFPLPTVIQGISVVVNGAAAPLLCARVNPDSSFQINYQLPWEITTQTAT